MMQCLVELGRGGTTAPHRLGLGLTEIGAIAVVRLGGVLAYAAAAGEGSLFVVWLPAG